MILGTAHVSLRSRTPADPLLTLNSTSWVRVSRGSDKPRHFRRSKVWCRLDGPIPLSQRPNIASEHTKKRKTDYSLHLKSPHHFLIKNQQGAHHLFVSFIMLYDLTQRFKFNISCMENLILNCLANIEQIHLTV